MKAAISAFQSHIKRSTSLENGSLGETWLQDMYGESASRLHQALSEGCDLRTTSIFGEGLYQPYQQSTTLYRQQPNQKDLPQGEDASDAGGGERRLIAM